jgi:hypothetical protein
MNSYLFGEAKLNRVTAHAELVALERDVVADVLQMHEPLPTRNSERGA